MVTRKRKHVAKAQDFELGRFSPLLDDEPAQPAQLTVEFKAKVWRWKSSGGWHFVTLPTSAAAKVRAACASTKRGGWGSIPVRVKIGDIEWETALFPHGETKSYLFAIKAVVRKAEDIVDGSRIEATVTLR